VLQYVSVHRIGRRVVEETLAMWPLESLRRDMSNAEQDALVAAFQQRAEQLMQRPPRAKGKRKRLFVEASDPSVASMPAPPSPSVSSSTTTADGSPLSSSLTTAARLPAANTAATATATTATALPWVLSGCVEKLAEQPDALTVIDLPLDFSVPLRASTRLALAATDNGAASPDAMALPVEEDSNAGAMLPSSKRHKAKVNIRRTEAVTAGQLGPVGVNEAEKMATNEEKEEKHREEPKEQQQRQSGPSRTRPLQRKACTTVRRTVRGGTFGVALSRVFFAPLTASVYVGLCRCSVQLVRESDFDNVPSAVLSTSAPSEVLSASIPPQNWLEILPNSEAPVFSFDTGDLPVEFRSYEPFRRAHAARIGRVVRYTRSVGHNYAHAIMDGSSQQRID